MIQQFKDSLVAAIQTVPIIYIPHFHFSYIDEIIEEVLTGNNGNMRLNFGADLVFELYANNALRDFKTKEPIEFGEGLNNILKEIESHYQIWTHKSTENRELNKVFILIFQFSVS